MTSSPLQEKSLHDDPSQSKRIADLSTWLAKLRDCRAKACRKAENTPPK